MKVKSHDKEEGEGGGGRGGGGRGGGGGQAYQLKALELTNSAIPLIYQSAHCGCAGIGRQLHPLKAKDLLKDKVIEIKRENDMWVLIYQSIAIEIATLTIPCQYIKGVLESVVNCIP